MENRRFYLRFTIYHFTPFSDSRFTIYGLSGEMGETILTNAM